MTLACLQGNQFGVFFERAAEKVGAAFRHTGFDSSVIQVGNLSMTPSWHTWLFLASASLAWAGRVSRHCSWLWTWRIS